MIKLFCDICGKDCGKGAFDLYVSVIHNPTPTNIHDTGKAKLTDDDTHVRYMLCDECYERTHLPKESHKSFFFVRTVRKMRKSKMKGRII